MSINVLRETFDLFLPGDDSLHAFVASIAVRVALAERRRDLADLSVPLCLLALLALSTVFVGVARFLQYMGVEILYKRSYEYRYQLLDNYIYYDILLLRTCTVLYLRVRVYE